jgi:hypothetical protein
LANITRGEAPQTLLGLIRRWGRLFATRSPLVATPWPAMAIADTREMPGNWRLFPRHGVRNAHAQSRGEVPRAQQEKNKWNRTK